MPPRVPARWQRAAQCAAGTCSARWPAHRSAAGLEAGCRPEADRKEYGFPAAAAVAFARRVYRRNPWYASFPGAGLSSLAALKYTCQVRARSYTRSPSCFALQETAEEEQCYSTLTASDGPEPTGWTRAALGTGAGMASAAADGPSAGTTRRAVSPWRPPPSRVRRRRRCVALADGTDATTRFGAADGCALGQ